MRIIKESTLRAAALHHPDAAAPLEAWRKAARAARWHSLAELRATYPHADAVRVASGRTVIVFNIAGNKFRLIAALHFDRQIVYFLRFLTHADYSKDRWKSTL